MFDCHEFVVYTRVNDAMQQNGSNQHCCTGYEVMLQSQLCYKVHVTTSVTMITIVTKGIFTTIQLSLKSDANSFVDNSSYL